MISKSAMSRTVMAAARTPALLNKAPLAATTLFRSITSFASHSSSSKSSTVATSALPRHWKLLPTYTTYTTTRAMSSNNEKNASFVSSSLFSCKDRIALVTGGGTGIGLMAVQALVANGAKVYITGRTKEKLDKVVELYSQGSGSIVPLVADVSKKDDIAKLVKEIESKEQSLDILINNAGIAGATQQTESESAAEMKKNLFDDESATFEDWTNTYRTNVPQIYFMTTAFLPLLQKSSERHHGWSGTVINISSISGMVMSAQHHFSYNASKAAAIHLNRMLASEIANNKLKIRVNSIAPGVFPSEMTASESGDDQKSHIPKDKYAEKVPAARPGKDEDMAQAVLFCATNQYLNGQTFAVDGGYTLAAGQ